MGTFYAVDAARLRHQLFALQANHMRKPRRECAYLQVELVAVVLSAAPLRSEEVQANRVCASVSPLHLQRT